MVKKWRRYEGIKEEISIKIIKRKQKEENGKKIIINYKKVYKQAAKIVKEWQKYIFQREKKEEKKKLIQKRKKIFTTYMSPSHYWILEEERHKKHTKTNLSRPLTCQIPTKNTIDKNKPSLLYTVISPLN